MAQTTVAVDTVSGTVVSTEGLVIIDIGDLDGEELDTLENGSDTERIALAIRYAKGA